MLTEFYTLNNIDVNERDDTWNNNMSNLKEQILSLSQSVNDEIIQNTFGNRSAMNLNTLEQQQKD